MTESRKECNLFVKEWIRSHLVLGKINTTEFVALSEITSLQSADRGFYMTDDALSLRLGLSVDRTGKVINSLKKKGLVTIVHINKDRYFRERQVRINPAAAVSSFNAAIEKMRLIRDSEADSKAAGGEEKAPTAPPDESAGQGKAPADGQAAEKSSLQEGGEQPQASTQVPPQRKAELARATKSTAPLADPAAAFHAAMAGCAVDDPIAGDPPPPVRAEDEDLPFGGDPLDDYTKAQIAYHSMNRAAQSARWSAYG